MIVTDLDGTLLRTDKTISGYTAETFHICRERGIKIVFATARPKRTVDNFLENITADAIVLHNGAVIYAGEKLIYRCGIAPGVARGILLSLNRDYPEELISTEIDDVNYSNYPVDEPWALSNFVVSDFTDLPDKSADKILVRITRAEEAERYRAYISDELYLQNNEGKLALIMHRDATKWNAVKRLAAHFGCDISEIAAFGDDLNDAEMIKNCGVGVAMANALNEVKAAADEICGSNNEDGVAHWLCRNVCMGDVND